MKFSSTDKAAGITAAAFFTIGCIEIQRGHTKAGVLFLLGAFGSAIMIYAKHKPKQKK